MNGFPNPNIYIYWKTLWPPTCHCKITWLIFQWQLPIDPFADLWQLSTHHVGIVVVLFLPVPYALYTYIYYVSLSLSLFCVYTDNISSYITTISWLKPIWHPVVGYFCCREIVQVWVCVSICLLFPYVHSLQSPNSASFELWKDML